MQRAHKDFPEKDVVVLAVSLDGDPSAPKKFLDENKFTMPAVHDKGMGVARQFGARGVPTTVIVDRRGYIVARGMGEVDFDHPGFRNLIKHLVAQPRP